MDEFRLKNLDGRDVTLADIASGKPTLFVFVRHFG